MKLILLCLMLASCAAGRDYNPTTMEGAQCKRDCAREMAACIGNVACDRAAATCMNACKDLDRMRAK